MRYLLFCLASVTTTLLWACGANTGPSDGSGGACTPDENVAGRCAAPAQCVMAGATCACDTDAGAFVCATGEPPDAGGPLGLPAVEPKNGDCCVTEGMTCGGWDICAPICHCHEGRWSCKDPDCPLFSCPAPVDKLSGQFCDDRIGDNCTSGVPGCSDVCTCQLDFALGRGMWQCSGLLCNFDAGFGEAGPPPPFDAGPPPPFDAGPIEGGSAADGG